MSVQVAARNGMGDAPQSLSNLFQAPKYQDRCQRCKEKVYAVEKIGPVNEVIFHKQCFRCVQCDQNITLRTYFTNPGDPNDNEVYCSKHAPKANLYKGLDSSAIGIKSALQAPAGMSGYNEQIRATGHKPAVSSDAMHIQHPVSQSKYRKNKVMTYSKHHFPAFLGLKAREKVQRAQVELERRQREEEDRLMKVFWEDREKEEQALQQQVDQEWEGRIKELTVKFDADMDKRGKKDKKVMTVKYEQEMDDLKKNMTVKLQKKKEAMTLHMQKEEQDKTSQMVKEHSKQMLELLAQEKEKLRQELKEEMDGEPGEESPEVAVALEEAIASLTMPSELPPPHPPPIRKRDLYIDPSVFDELDQDVINVAQRDHGTFTELVSELTQHCLNDLQKARAIFRWITVKDLNVIDFIDTVDTDTPMGLLRGIKYGTETYHTLFMRLCSYAGMACVEVKGHSKSVGYEPGMKIREESFQNTWNAVVIEGDWWPVQCNWGARHLVLNKDVQEKPAVKSKKQDKIRYQYDEHYFLTDPDEFIQEFWAQEPDWQLLEKPISLEEFESMPFVRSVFFHYGLEFDHPMKSVIYSDNKGGAEVKIRVPFEYAQDIVFHYQIRFADRDRRNDTEFRGAKLERFVFHSLVDGMALFSVHVPTPASYFLEIFANKIDETNRIGDDPNATMMPFRLKCACKFKIVCDELVGKMHPLPNCASGEWGPSKGRRHFGLVPLTHATGVVNVDNDAEVRFKLPRALHFLCKLRMNGVEDHILERFIAHSVQDNQLTVRIRPPQPGQFGLDIYARPEEAADNHTLAHACKYLLNCTRVEEVIDLPSAKVDKSSAMSQERWGAAPQFQEFGMKTISHSEPRFEKTDAAPLVIEIGHHDNLKLTYRLVREPDEDCRERVTMKESSKKVKFTINFDKQGHYMFAVYAKKKKEMADPNLINVYNYHIKYYPSAAEETNTMKKKKKSLFGSKK